MAKSGLAAALAATALAATAAHGAPQTAYHIVKSVPLGAPDRWDYLHVDTQTHRVYVAHGDRISVVDGQSGAVVGTVTGMPGGTHGIAISHETDQGFTDDGEAGQAVAFDLKTLKVKARIKAEPDADGVLYDAPSQRIYVIDGDSGKVTAIDPKSDKAVATVDVGTKLEFGVSGDNGKLYIDEVATHSIARIDTTSEKVDATWVLPDCETPRGLAIDRAHHRLFATCGSGTMVVVNAESGATVATLPIGKGSDAARFDAKRGIAFSSNFDGTLSLIREDSPDRFTALVPVQTVLGARTMGLDEETGRVFLIAGKTSINPDAKPNDYRHRYKTEPGSATLYFLDPVTQ